MTPMKNDPDEFLEIQEPEEPEEELSFAGSFKSGFVAVLGRPNVGKSTLVNRVIGQKIAIVSEKPQTTRTKIMGILTDSDSQMVFLDTPGLHTPRHKLGEAMVDTARRTIPDADLILFVVDGSEPLTEEDRNIAELLRKDAKAPVLLIVNKADNYSQGTELAFLDEVNRVVTLTRGMSVSALAGQGIPELLAVLKELLPIGPQYYPEDEVTDQQERVIAAELVREQVLHNTRQEIPHSVAVVVEDFKERPDGTTYVNATIYVEKESQKHIVIGHGGEMLKRIGQGARIEIEKMVDGKVFLDLWVKLRKDWRKKDPSLKEMGYRG